MTLTKAADEAQEAFDKLNTTVEWLLKAAAAFTSNTDKKKEWALWEKSNEAWHDALDGLINVRNRLAKLEKALADYLKENKDKLALDKKKLNAVNSAKDTIAKIKKLANDVEAALRAGA